jgi:hypothetical protein
MITLLMTAIDLLDSLETTAGLVPSEATGLNIACVPSDAGDWWTVAVEGDFVSTWDPEAEPVNIALTLAQ